MPNIDALSLILHKILARLKFFVADRRTDKLDNAKRGIPSQGGAKLTLTFDPVTQNQ